MTSFPTDPSDPTGPAKTDDHKNRDIEFLNRPQRAEPFLPPIPSATPLLGGAPFSLFSRRANAMTWAYLGAHDARIAFLEGGWAENHRDIKSLRSNIEDVQLHLAHQDQDMRTITAGIAELHLQQTQRASEHRSTLRAIRIAIVSTLCSGLMGLVLFLAERALVH